MGRLLSGLLLSGPCLGGLFRVCTLMLPLPQGYLTLNPALLAECAMNCGAYTTPRVSTTSDCVGCVQLLISQDNSHENLMWRWCEVSGY